MAPKKSFRHASQRLTRLAIVLLLLSMSPFAASVSGLGAEGPVGKWEATMETQRGTNDVQMEFEEKEGVLSGTWTGPRGSDALEKVAHEDGKLTFERNLEFQGNAVKLTFEAIIDGDTMNVTMTTPRGERQFTAKRAE